MLSLSLRQMLMYRFWADAHLREDIKRNAEANLSSGSSRLQLGHSLTAALGVPVLPKQFLSYVPIIIIGKMKLCASPSPVGLSFPLSLLATTLREERGIWGDRKHWRPGSLNGDSSPGHRFR